MQGTRHLLLRTFALLLFLLLAHTTPARAAAVHVRPFVTTVVRDNLSSAEWTPDGAGGALIEPEQGNMFVIIDFTVEIHDLDGPPNEVGFGNVVFNIELAGAASDLFGWTVGSDIDIDGFHCYPQPYPLPCIPKFSDNADMGIPGDLIDIVVGVAPRSFVAEGEDPRRTIGQFGPEKMGSIVAAIDSDFPSNQGRVEAVVTAFSTYDENLLLARNDGPRFGGAVVLRVVPEPPAVTIALSAGFCVLLLVRRIRFRRSGEKSIRASRRVRWAFTTSSVLFLLVSSEQAARAATVHVTPVLSGIELRPGESAEWTPDGAGGALIEPGQGSMFVVIQFNMEIHDLAGPPDEVGFGNVVFDIIPSGGALDPGFGWTVETCHTTRCPFPLRWADNGDLGTFGDLIDIVVGVAPRTFSPEDSDPRRLFGQFGPEFMGSVAFVIDSDVRGNHGHVEAVVKAFSTFDEDLLLARNDGPRFGGAVELRVVPEPPAVAMALSAGFCVLLFGAAHSVPPQRRKRDCSS